MQKRNTYGKITYEIEHGMHTISMTGTANDGGNGHRNASAANRY